MTRRRGLSRLSAVIGLMLLAGCVGNPLTSTDNVAAVNKAAPQGGATFTQNLAHEYALFASRQLNESHYDVADHFAKKGLAASRGQAVPPENVGSWSISADRRSEIATEGSRLTATLNGGARESAPAVAARAQARYDCWIEEQDEGWEGDQIARCRNEYMAAMNELTKPVAPAAVQPPPAAALQYQVYFDFDRATLTPDARRVVEAAAAAAKQHPNQPIELVGRADLVGSDRFNQRLSERRAQAVLDALVGQGIPRNLITARGVGKREPPVPTPEGVREARNRVVDVTIGSAAAAQ